MSGGTRWVRRAATAALATMTTIGSGAALAAPADLSGDISGVVVQDGRVSFTVDAGALPQGVLLDPDSVSVTADGTKWSATATPVDRAAATVPRRAVIVVDTSGSMGEGGIADARAAANAFLDAVPEDVTVGLVTFSEEAHLVVEPTQDRQSVRAGLDAMTPGGDTALYDGIEVALGALGADGDRALVVLSDGKDTASRSTFESSRDALAASGVAAHLVAFRTEDSQTDVLEDLAAPAQGVVVEATDRRELADVFAASARAIVHKVLVEAAIPDGVEGTDAEIVVSMAAGASSVAATTTVPVPEAAPPPPPSNIAASQPSTSAVTSDRPWVLPVVVVLAFAALFLLFAVLLAPSTWRGSPSARRAHDIARYALADSSQARSAVAASPGVVSEAALAWADRRIQGRGVEDSWQLVLDRAGLPLKPHEWLILKMSAAVVGFAIAVVLLPWWLLTGPLLGLLAWVLAGVFLKVKAKRRAGKFAEELPDVLQLVAGSLSSGFSFPQAIDNAASEGQEPIAGELSRALAESRLGVQVEDALDHVATRMASTDLSWTVMAVRISREVGGNLAEVLLSTAETMRERGRVRRQVKALSAEGRLSAYILIALPIVIAGWMVLFRREYVAPLVTEPLGIAMSVFAILTMAFGAWWMSRLIKLEV